MELQMYAFTTKTEPQTSVDFPHPADSRPLHQWWNSPNLHGWMRQLYKENGGTNSEFKLATLWLTDDDLDYLASCLYYDRQGETTGFFSNPPELHNVETDEFLRKARWALDDRRHVFYQAWW